jgi:hypothetical protein
LRTAWDAAIDQEIASFSMKNSKNTQKLQDSTLGAASGAPVPPKMVSIGNDYWIENEQESRAYRRRKF